MKAEKTLIRRSAAIDMSEEQFRTLGHQLIDRIADLLATIGERPVSSAKSPDEIRELLASSNGLPEQGGDPSPLLERVTNLLMDHSLFNGHPRFFGYITASAAPIGVLGDLLAAGVNPNVGAWQLSPVASEIEAQTVRWIAELLGFPVDCGGLMVSGGNMANFTCFLAARAAKAGWDVRRRGLADRDTPRLRIYASTETHTWLEKAADMFGFGTDAIHEIPADRQHRMDLSALSLAIEEDRSRGDQPWLLVGSAGTVGTGAVDPLPEMAALCREQDLWFHVDGAYGGFAAAAPSASDDLRGLALADSVAVDPHKWLYAPLEAGCALVRDPEMLRNAFSYHPEYYHFGVEAVNYFDHGLQNSRGFRALKVWLALGQVGRAGYARMIEDDIALARRLFEIVDKHAEFEAVSHGLSVTTFRYVPPDLAGRTGAEDAESYLNRLNEELLKRLEKCGEIFLSNAIIDGKFALRTCIVNFRTSEYDIEQAPEIIAKYGRQVDEELRASEGGL